MLAYSVVFHCHMNIGASKPEYREIYRNWNKLTVSLIHSEYSVWNSIPRRRTVAEWAICGDIHRRTLVRAHQAISSTGRALSLERGTSVLQILGMLLSEEILVRRRSNGICTSHLSAGVVVFLLGGMDAACWRGAWKTKVGYYV